MLFEVGEKVHVVERRLFDTDVRRHFCGVIDAVDTGAIRVTGYVFVYDPGTSGYVRSASQRTRTVPTAASGFVINLVPSETKTEDVRYEVDGNGHLTVTDGDGFSLDINEFGRSR